MPTAPLRCCSYPGCDTLVTSGRCEQHQPHKPQYSKLYSTARWRRESRRFLQEHPLCECDGCRREGLFVAATVVDHSIPHRGSEALFWDRKNWAPMAKQCHDRKTGKEVARRSAEWKTVEGS